MAGIGWLAIGLCAVLTAMQIPAWSSDLALWQAAAVASPLAPRPLVNLAAQMVLQGRYAEAHAYQARAEQLIVPLIRARERAVVRQVIDQQRAWIDAYSFSR